ncbi:MAG: prephenate dehydrogenase [Clostridia bacterium]|nr:prephenate dehydrogenase [Clostridia bacterium]
MKQFPNLIPDCTVLVVGMGLIGGAYAKALSEKGYRVLGITRSREVIDEALREGTIADGDTAVNPALIAEANIIIFGLYPAVLLDWIDQNGHLITPGTVVTDVTGVKGCVVERVQEMLPMGVEFISAHPMAGKELIGSNTLDVYCAATPDMFRGANYLVVPTDKNTPEAIRLCEQLGRLLGFGRVTRLTVEEHDRTIAYLSQLTHAIAVSLMCCAGEGSDTASDADIARLSLLTGDSFRDLTRIAKINDTMWSELFLSNREALLEQMDLFSERFTAMRDALAEGDSDKMREMMRLSTTRRNYFDKNSR